MLIQIIFATFWSSWVFAQPDGGSIQSKIDEYVKIVDQSIIANSAQLESCTKDEAGSSQELKITVDFLFNKKEARFDIKNGSDSQKICLRKKLETMSMPSWRESNDLPMTRDLLLGGPKEVKNLSDAPPASITHTQFAQCRTSPTILQQGDCQICLRLFSPADKELTYAKAIKSFSTKKAKGSPVCPNEEGICGDYRYIKASTRLFEETNFFDKQGNLVARTYLGDSFEPCTTRALSRRTYAGSHVSCKAQRTRWLCKGNK